MRIGILGFGEVGQAIAKFYKSPLIKDLDRDDDLTDLDVLHVCIPYSNNFIKIVNNWQEKSNARMVIINSTVLPGTTKKIKNAVHSPVRGVHPNLYEGIKTFTKYVGADDKELGSNVVRHLRKIGINAELMGDSKTTEIFKILDTTYYGLCIAWHNEMEKICCKLNVNFDLWGKYNIDYNCGYAELDKDNVIRPTLFTSKHIGGHCVIPNAKILNKIFKSEAIKLILKYQ